MVVLVGRYTRADKTEEELFVINDLILVTEAGKFMLAAILEYRATNGNLAKSIKENIIDAPVDALKILIPSMLYLLQNTLLYTALSNLSAPIFQVTYQSKLLTTAVVSVVMLQRRYSPKQWVCLCMLGMGVAIVVLGEKKNDDGESKEAEEGGVVSQSLTVGLFAVTVACFSSALAGVYFEKVLKKPVKVSSEEGMEKTKNPVSLWMRNIQMAFFSISIAIVNGNFANDSNNKKAFLHGFTPSVWTVVILQAGGGLLVAAVIKYADNVLKGLATGVSVVVATACSMVLFDTPLTMQFTVGAVFILASVYFFSNDLPGEKKIESKTDQNKAADEELQKPLVKSEQ